jgi:hypothetical protein
MGCRGGEFKQSHRTHRILVRHPDRAVARTFTSRLRAVGRVLRGIIGNVSFVGLSRRHDANSEAARLITVRR